MRIWGLQLGGVHRGLEGGCASRDCLIDRCYPSVGGLVSPQGTPFSYHLDSLCPHYTCRGSKAIVGWFLFSRGSLSLNDIVDGKSMCKREEKGVAFLGDPDVLGPPPCWDGPLEVLRL